MDARRPQAARPHDCCGGPSGVAQAQTEGKAAVQAHAADPYITPSDTTMPLLSPSAKKKQQKIGGVPLDLARAVLGAVFDTLDETRTGSLEVAELQRVGFKTATMVGSPSDAQVDREAFVRTIVSLLGRKNADDSAKLLPEAVALCGRVFRLRAAAAARDAADLARAEAEEKADVARYAARTRAERATTDGRRAEAAAAEGRRIADGLRGRLEAAEDELGRVRAALRDATADAEATAAKMERLQEALARGDTADRVAELEEALAAANERVRAQAPDDLRDQLAAARADVKAVLARADNAEKRVAEANEACAAATKRAEVAEARVEAAERREVDAVTDATNRVESAEIARDAAQRRADAAEAAISSSADAVTAATRRADNAEKRAAKAEEAMTAAVQRAQTAGDAVAAAGDAAALLAQAETRISEERQRAAAAEATRDEEQRRAVAAEATRDEERHRADAADAKRTEASRRAARAEKALATAIDREKTAEAKTTEVLRRAKTAETAAGMAEAAVQAAVRKAEKAEAELARQRTAQSPEELHALRQDLARAKAARDQAEARLAKGGSGAADHFRAALSGLLAGLSLDDNSDDGGALDVAELLDAGAEPDVVAAIDTEGRGRIAPAVLVDILAQSSTYQSAEQSASMLREWAQIAVAVLDDRHRARRNRENDSGSGYNVGAMFCGLDFSGE